MRNVRTVVDQWRRRGVKITRRRVAILDSLLGDTTHPSAEILYRRLHKKSGISFATVYNNLESMVRLGDVDVVTVKDTMRFDPNIEPHHHAVCESCGAVFDVPATRQSRRLRAALPKGFQSRRVSVEFRGSCGACRKKAGRDGSR